MRIVPLVALLAMALPAWAQAPAPSTGSSARPPAASAPAPAPAASSAPTTGQRLDVNLATAAELEAALPGIGAARSAAIVQHRPYRTPEEVVAKAGVPQAVFDGIRDRVTATQINVNAASEREMVAALPGIGDARAAGIVRGRPYASLDELATKGGLPRSVLDHIRPALTLR